VTDPQSSSPGDSLALQALHHSISRGQLAHSILLHGRSREALERLAFHLAGQLLDHHPSTGSQSVVEHPDFFSLRPSRKLRQISAVDTRELIRRIHHSPQGGLKKIAVVFEADRFNATSANIFLKTLEEPPLDTTILLLSTRPYSLLATIRSRCLRIRVTDEIRRDDDAEITAWFGRYRHWLDTLAEGRPAKKEVPDLVLGIYALVSDLKGNLERITRESLGDNPDLKREDLSDEEKTAIETGLSVSVRDLLLVRIEETTAEFARAQIRSDKEFLAARLPSAIDALEEISRLLPLNYQMAYAVEQFLLASLRIWTAPKG